MAETNHDRVGKGLALTKEGLRPFVERELQNAEKVGRLGSVHALLSEMRYAHSEDPLDDVSVLLNLMIRAWNPVFSFAIGPTERNYAHEVVGARHRWAHQSTFSSDDAERALDTMARLLTAVSATIQAEAVAQMRQALLRQVYQEQVRQEKRRTTSSTIETGTALRPWREVVTPHDDVARGTYQQAEFAADLWQVHLGEGADEYRDPVEFFRRTFLTESLKGLLVGAVQRLHGAGGDPVVQLQTNFGGGKTHSMLALYHLFSGIDPRSLPGMDDVLAAAEVTTLPEVRRVVLVGNKISPGNPDVKPDGTVVRTLWGELAWQLAGSEALDYIAWDDERATNPGDALRELFVKYGPCMILIDEWVAYARQLHDEADLPGGSFETQFTFAQALTEAAKLARNTLLVVSLPASDTSGSHAQADDVEVGGSRGREALDRLRNVVGRIDSSWRPATAEEGFEIVRRRLFAPMTSDAAFRTRDVVARGFADLYKAQAAEFPSETRDLDYERRIQNAYPIHPEVFDRLYSDWSTLVRFQRTRGVLRLMAAVIHSLWQNQDASPLIMPATIPIDDPRVRDELTRYLPDHWTPIIEKDVDGPNSLPREIDSATPALGRYSATRRVARSVFLGTAPLTSAATRGLDISRVRLGSVLPGETVSLATDALTRLSNRATYLYRDDDRYWYSTTPTVLRMAEDRAEQLKRDPDKVAEEIEKRLKVDIARRGEFARVHVAPQSSGDVPDDPETRLVILGPGVSYVRGDRDAENAAREILEQRGTMPRARRNTLVFLVADRTRLTELEDATRRYMAWKAILDSDVKNDLTPAQQNQAANQRATAESTMLSRIPETYQWLLVPEQHSAQESMTWSITRLTGAEPLAERASRRLVSDEGMVPRLGANMLKRHLDRVPLWSGYHVSVRQLSEYFCNYLYLPRLKNPDVLLATIAAGPGSMSWESDGFAYAEDYDEARGRYINLVAGPVDGNPQPIPTGLVVKSEVALAQRQAEERERQEREARERAERDERERVRREKKDEGDPDEGDSEEPVDDRDDDEKPPVVPPVRERRLTRYHGTVALNAMTPASSLSKIVEEVIVHLTSQVGANVNITLEIDADIPDGAPEHIVRTVTENGLTLKFISQGFEED